MEIIEPQAIDYSFQTLGWKIILGIIVIIIVILMFLAWKNWKKNKYRRVGVLMVHQCSSVNQINTLLKKTALMIWNRNQVASLSGEKWLCFLNKTMKNSFQHTDLFVKMEEDCYYPSNEQSTIDNWKEFAALWFKKHRKLNV
ncbi:MAG: DUF4381 domain-containing protein [Mangrovibacterium sp.]